MMNKADVLVVGGGVIGLSAALAMQRRGFTTVILEKNVLKRDVGSASRVYAINQASQQLLGQLGVWSKIEKTKLSAYQHMHIWDAASHVSIDFDARMILADHLGFMIEESVLKNALLTCVLEQNIPLISEYSLQQVISSDSAGASIQVTDGKTPWSATLLIAADGAHSRVRESLKVPVTTWSYYQQAIVTTIRTERSHQKTAYQVFHTTGPLALLPMADVNHCSIVWSTTPQEAERLLALSEAEFNLALMQAFGPKLGHIEAVAPRYNFPLHMRHVQQYAGPGWLLMGDAAHTIHPLAGLGLNVGFADLAAWLKVIENTRAIGLRRYVQEYQRQRKTQLWQIIFVMEALHRLFKSSLFLIVGWRALGLGLTNRLIPLKRLLIEYAAGTR